MAQLTALNRRCTSFQFPTLDHAPREIIYPVTLAMFYKLEQWVHQVTKWPLSS
jgi:hypothetical protein